MADQGPDWFRWMGVTLFLIPLLGLACVAWRLDACNLGALRRRLANQTSHAMLMGGTDPDLEDVQ